MNMCKTPFFSKIFSLTCCLSFFLLSFLSSPAAFAATQENGQPCPPECVTDSMEIVTWYPSPYNEYEELRLYPVQRDDSYCTDDKKGLMYYHELNNKVYVCKGVLIGWKEVGAFVAPDSVSGNIYYNSGNVGIGVDSPKTVLDVGGVLTFRSQSNPGVSNSGEGRLYFDSANNKFKISENGAAYKDLGAQAAGVQQVSGSNPSCPSGQYALVKKWTAKTCGSPGCGNGYCPPNVSQCWGPCTTGSGWLDSPPSCTYSSPGGSGCYLNYPTCTADSWSDVVCIGS